MNKRKSSLRLPSRLQKESVGRTSARKWTVTVAESEVKIAAKKIAIRKVPSLDGVPGLAIKTAALNVSYIFKETFNACVSEGIFPAQWKIQRLVLLPKGNKPPDEPSAYRPLHVGYRRKIV